MLNWAGWDLAAFLKWSVVTTFTLAPVVSTFRIQTLKCFLKCTGAGIFSLRFLSDET